MSASEWANRDDRQADARAEYEKIMTTGSPDPTGAYIDAGVIGFVFGEMWRRGVLTPRDRRFITLSCVGAMGADIPIETHSWAGKWAWAVGILVVSYSLALVAYRRSDPPVAVA